MSGPPLVWTQLLLCFVFASGQIHFPGEEPFPSQPPHGRPNVNFPGERPLPSDQKSPNVFRTFKDGCVCESANVCPRDKGQLQHACVLQGNGKGICCIDQQGVVVTRFGTTNPNSVGAVSVSQSTMSDSLSEGRRGLNRILQADQRRLSAGQFVPTQTPAAGHARFFYRNPSAIQKSNLAYQLALATVDVARRENLTPAQAQFGLSQARTSPGSILGTQCPNSERISCGSFEERFRTIDGTCNNLRDPRRGRSETGFSRLRPALYDDGIMSPRKRSVLGGPLPNVRSISSNVLIDRDNPSPDFTLNVMQWAQFMDHDLTHAPFPDMNGEPIQCCDNGRIVDPQPQQCFVIEIPPQDGFYDFQRPPQKCINFVRSMFAVPPGCQFGPAEQMNVLTHWVDGSMVYGSIEDEFERVRDPRSPKLRETPQRSGLPLLPTNRSIDCEARVPGTPCFVAGDSRVNEQPGLTVMHTIWVREHNRIVDALQNFFSDQEELFQQARRIVIAEIQHITYAEWLPIILGQRILRQFDLALPSGFSNKYDPGADPRMSNEFATAAFRFGHSLVSGFFNLFTVDGRSSFRQLREVFNDPSILQRDPSLLDAYVNSLVQQQVQDLERFITVDLSNHLFQTTKFKFGMDLMSLNIQRGRDHAISTYNDMRESFSGFGRARNFDDLRNTHSEQSILSLQRVYAHVDDIDFFPGGMSERNLDGGLLGPTIGRVVAAQFRDTRNADRFFYKFGGHPGAFTAEQLNEIEKSSMARVFCDNSRVTVMQPNAFVRPQGANQKTSCAGNQIPNMDLRVFARSRG